MEITVREAAAVCGGRVLGPGEETVLRHITTDSRVSQGSDLFVPIIGERTDGHRFIDGAFAAGCAASLTSDPEAAPHSRPLILVRDTEKALQALGRHFRAAYKGPVVGVTGSVGKTTTREMIKLALSVGGPVTGTEKNFNSPIGLPITLCHMDSSASAAVLEMGISLPGEMDLLADLARPTAAVITNIGTSHIEFLGSREGILEEKWKITSFLRPDQTAVLCADDDLLVARLGQAPFATLGYGFSPAAAVRAENVREDAFAQTFDVILSGPCVPQERRFACSLQVPGRHNVLNALAAVAAAASLDIDPQEAAEKLAEYGGFSRRLQLRRAGGLTVIDDSYNASVPSVKAALDVLCRAPGRRIALLADMKELGEMSAPLHREVGRYAAALPIELFLTLGDAIRDTEAELAAAGRTVLRAQDREDAVRILREIAADGDTLLLKGSNSMKLNEIADALCTPM